MREVRLRQLSRLFLYAARVEGTSTSSWSPYSSGAMAVEEVTPTSSRSPALYPDPIRTQITQVKILDTRNTLRRTDLGLRPILDSPRQLREVRVTQRRVHPAATAGGF
jgi:hypothetical protein